MTIGQVPGNNITRFGKGQNGKFCQPPPIFFRRPPSPIFIFGFHSAPQDLRLDIWPYNNVSEAHDESDEHLANLFVCGRFQIHVFFCAIQCTPLVLLLVDGSGTPGL